MNDSTKVEGDSWFSSKAYGRAGLVDWCGWIKGILTHLIHTGECTGCKSRSGCQNRIGGVRDGPLFFSLFSFPSFSSFSFLLPSFSFFVSFFVGLFVCLFSCFSFASIYR